MGVTSLHGTPVYLLTQSLARSLKRIQIHTYMEGSIRSYYRAGAIKEGSLEISGWRTQVSIEFMVRASGTDHENQGGWLVESTRKERVGKRERSQIASERVRGRTKLLNMHGPNGTGRGRDKGRLIFPAFHFVPSLFYFGANCYRYPLRHRRWSLFLPFPRTRVKPSCNLKFSHRYLISRSILSKSIEKAAIAKWHVTFFQHITVRRCCKKKICMREELLKFYSKYIITKAVKIT